MNCLVLLLAFTLSSLAHAQSPHPFLDHKQVDMRLKYWAPSQFSDPAQHDPAKFRYLVHKIDAPSVFMTWGMNKWAPIQLQDPSKVIGNPRICSSVINEEFPYTFYGSIGFVLSVPAINIGAMTPEDMVSTGTSDSDQAYSYFWGMLRNNPKFFTPRQLVDETKARRRSWNEVLVTGRIPKETLKTPSDSAIKVQALILDCKKPSRLFKSGVVTEMVKMIPEEEQAKEARKKDKLSGCLATYPKSHRDTFIALVHKLYDQGYPIIMFKRR